MSAKQRAKTLTPEEIVDLCFAKALEYERFEDTKQQKMQLKRKLREYREEMLNVIGAADNGEDEADGRTDTAE